MSADEILREYETALKDALKNDGTENWRLEGIDSDVTTARWLYYEGVWSAIDPGLLSRAMPIVAFNVLVKSYGYSWCRRVVDGREELGVAFDDRQCFVSDLENGKWVDLSDYDEPPAPGEVAIDSFERLANAIKWPNGQLAPPGHRAGRGG